MPSVAVLMQERRWVGAPPVLVPVPPGIHGHATAAVGGRRLAPVAGHRLEPVVGSRHGMKD